ncbi:hypothetical protein HanXRQr2_Chr09g0401091 [Helianthus annuus]|uniref:Uncharacterized protein n=1 Tax=Helianthus annuus TaxID=4232 RepID=A0A9K3I9E0_HELAN|nr:hypothetical protein HanXRQr2_Chr09g0401091 [Helianthus annuus]KAJ0894247.1 hypothetical protein HanPSC8_Chr09g0386911 [Helianthus annuus]
MVIGPGLNPGPGPGPPVNRVSNDDCGGSVITGGTWRWCCGVSAMRFLSLRDGVSLSRNWVMGLEVL